MTPAAVGRVAWERLNVRAIRKPPSPATSHQCVKSLPKPSSLWGVRIYKPNQAQPAQPFSTPDVQHHPVMQPFVGLLAPLVAAASALALGPPVAPPAANGTFLEMTAIVARNNNSAFECWRLTDAFATSAGAGTAGAATMDIKNLANATYTALPPRFEGGVHNAPHPQCVAPFCRAEKRSTAVRSDLRMVSVQLTCPRCSPGSSSSSRVSPM